jgi:hypothetical protein
VIAGPRFGAEVPAHSSSQSRGLKVAFHPLEPSLNSKKLALTVDPGGLITGRVETMRDSAARRSVASTRGYHRFRGDWVCVV